MFTSNPFKPPQLRVENSWFSRAVGSFTLDVGQVSSDPGEPGEVPSPLVTLTAPFPLHL